MQEQTINFDAIPDVLRKSNQWLNWTAVAKENGKITKIPINFHTGGKGSSTNSATWASLSDVEMGFFLDGYAGIGYTFTIDDGIVGVDLDDCFQSNGKLKTWARDVVDKLDSYTEISPSGNGLHVLVLSSATEMSYNKDGREMYSEGRYFTVTGNVFEDRSEMNDRDLAVRSLYKEWRKRANVKFEKAGEYVFDESAVIVPIEETGMSPDMIDKWVNGVGVDPSKRSESLYEGIQQMFGIGHNNETILTHATNPKFYLGQVALADSRGAGNIRRARYWVWTQVMAKARTEVKERVTQVRKTFDSFDEDDDFIDDEKDSEQQLREVYTKEYSLNAKQYLIHNNLVRNQGQFYSYDGKSWSVDSDEAVESNIYKTCDGFGLQMSVIDHTIKAVKRNAHIEEFKTSKTKIAFNNGVIDLANWEYDQIDMTLLDHKPEYHVLSKMDYDFEPEADCPNWLSFLNEVFEGDQQRIELLRQWAGYILVYDYRFQKMLLMIGESRSGKGVITKVFQSLLGGEAFVGTTMSNISGDFGLHAIKDAKVASIGDAHRAPKDRIERTKEVFLNVTGGDQVTVNRKNKTEIATTIPARLMLSANRFPNFIDEYDALLNRYLVLPFNVTFAGRENVTLFDELKVELPGIFNWALKGLLELGKSGEFITPDAGEVRKLQIREQQNPIGAFIKEFLVVGGKDEKVLTDELYATYEMFCSERSLFTATIREFGKRIVATAGIDKIRQRVNGERTYFYTGISMKDSSKLYTALTQFDEYD